jgi:pantothenate kinase
VAASADGYHFQQEYLLRTLDEEGNPLAQHKGRYDSFDVSAMKRDLERFVRGEPANFPEYSRKIHDPVANAIRIEGATLLIFEGLWLLYDHAPWNELLSLYDLTIFFHANPEARKRNTITRHVRGNEHPPREAEAFYESSDAKNAEFILHNVAEHDAEFLITV